MNNAYKTLIVSAILLGTTGAAYAAKPIWAGNTMTKEEKVAAKATAKETKVTARAEAKVARAAKTKAVVHMYLYEEITETYDYETQAWGKLMIHNRKQSVIVNAHNLEADAEYALFLGETEVGRALANEYGDAHIKGMIPAEVEGEWTLRSVDGETSATVLVDSETRIKPLIEEEVEEEEEEETM